jgi:methionyl-tRNA synthetase
VRKHGLDFDEYFKPDSRPSRYHFIGKDILYFHALFWPAELLHFGGRTPTRRLRARLPDRRRRQDEQEPRHLHHRR